MKVVGLTGGIASGKSTVVSTILSLNIPVIDCDVLARLVVEPGHSAYKKLAAHFGGEIFQNKEVGQPLDRAKLGSIIFTDAAQRRVVNSIIHPAVRDEILSRLLKFWIKGTSLVVIDVPLLLEGELWRIVSEVIVVYWYLFNAFSRNSKTITENDPNNSENIVRFIISPPEVQLARIQSRDGLTEQEAQARIDSQRPLIEKVDYADHVIYNISDLDSLKKSTLQVMEAIKPNPIWTVLGYFPPITFLMAAWVIVKRHLKGDPRKTATNGSRSAVSTSAPPKEAQKKV